jgi:hypothetical protein
MLFYDLVWDCGTPINEETHELLRTLYYKFGPILDKQKLKIQRSLKYQKKWNQKKWNQKKSQMKNLKN